MCLGIRGMGEWPSGTKQYTGALLVWDQALSVNYQWQKCVDGILYIYIYIYVYLIKVANLAVDIYIVLCCRSLPQE